MPGAIQVSLKRKPHRLYLMLNSAEVQLVFIPAGESVFYNSNILHCASYDASAPRATLHATIGNVAGGSVRARNILQHGLGWMKEPQFRESLNQRGTAMLDRLMKLYNSVGDVGYSLSS